jgi:hypothetical protein
VDKGQGKLESQPFTAAPGWIRFRVYHESELSTFENDFLGQVT